jgi:hypothetical protein
MIGRVSVSTVGLGTEAEAVRTEAASTTDGTYMIRSGSDRTDRGPGARRGGHTGGGPLVLTKNQLASESTVTVGLAVAILL